ncbi:four helix bundle protein [Candidatus Saccharibacteria bacterium CPR2]|nr:four helix bundle protein [Candidatus Saccharibacteria bacterium CPR2]
MKYQLEDRTIKFGQDIITLCRSAKIDIISRPIVTQLIRSGTSIGANYAEANNASSKKDFRNKIYIAKKEAQETTYWLKILKTCEPNNKLIDNCLLECKEILLILQAITRKINSDNMKSTIV